MSFFTKNKEIKIIIILLIIVVFLLLFSKNENMVNLNNNSYDYNQDYFPKYKKEYNPLYRQDYNPMYRQDYIEYCSLNHPEEWVICKSSDCKDPIPVTLSMTTTYSHDKNYVTYTQIYESKQNIPKCYNNVALKGRNNGKECYKIMYRNVKPTTPKSGIVFQNSLMSYLPNSPLMLQLDKENKGRNPNDYLTY